MADSSFEQMLGGSGASFNDMVGEDSSFDEMIGAPKPVTKPPSVEGIAEESKVEAEKEKIEGTVQGAYMKDFFKSGSLCSSGIRSEAAI